jgi:hypothetical protein
MSNNNKTIGIVATIAAIATIMAFASFFTAATKVYAQANTTGNATSAKPASSSSSMQSLSGRCFPPIFYQLSAYPRNGRYTYSLRSSFYRCAL